MSVVLVDIISRQIGKNIAWIGISERQKKDLETIEKNYTPMRRQNYAKDDN